MPSAVLAAFALVEGGRAHSVTVEDEHGPSSLRYCVRVDGDEPGSESRFDTPAEAMAAAMRMTGWSTIAQLLRP